MEPYEVSEVSENTNPDVTLNAATTEAQNTTDSATVTEPEANEKTTEDVAAAPACAMTKEEILAELEQAVEGPVDEVKDKIAQLKSAFYSLKKDETPAEGEATNEPAAEADPAEEKFKELNARYKERRALHIAEVEALKQANLDKKNDILHQLEAIVADTDNINKQYNHFQQLQQEFKAIGDVPAENVTQLWKSYQLVTESFYDRLKINKDLRDYDFKKNLEVKEDLCTLAEALDTDNDIVNAFKKLQELHEQWRETGPVSPEIREEIWQRFKAASTAINKKYQTFFESRKEKEKENEAAKTALCERLEAIDMATLKSYAAWDKATEEIKALQEEWKKLGFAPRKVNVELFARFRKTCDEFFARKAEYFKSMKEEATSNLQKKIALCEKAEALKDSTDWKKTSDELIAIQKEWKTIGSVAKRHSDAVWKRFISACDYFFEQKEKQTSSIHKEEHANLEAKKKIIAKLNELLAAEAPENPAATVRELMNSWRGIGHVPYKEKDAIYNEYQDAVKKAYDKFDIREVKAKISSYETSVEQLGGDSNKLLREREKIMRRYEQKQNELKTFENNMLFFTAKSKSGNSILKEMEKKIANIREELSLIEKKIEVIDSKLQED